jgi:hypothetical protein
MNQIINGGKRQKTRKVNKSLKDWVTFVKKVQKEENISYKEAIHRAKVRKDKGEKWLTGGKLVSSSSTSSTPLEERVRRRRALSSNRGRNSLATRTRPRAIRTRVHQSNQGTEDPSNGHNQGVGTGTRKRHIKK